MGGGELYAWEKYSAGRKGGGREVGGGEGKIGGEWPPGGDGPGTERGGAAMRGGGGLLGDTQPTMLVMTGERGGGDRPLADPPERTLLLSSWAELSSMLVPRQSQHN